MAVLWGLLTSEGGDSREGPKLMGYLEGCSSNPALSGNPKKVLGGQHRAQEAVPQAAWGKGGPRERPWPVLGGRQGNGGQRVLRPYKCLIDLPWVTLLLGICCPWVPVPIRIQQLSLDGTF